MPSNGEILQKKIVSPAVVDLLETKLIVVEPFDEIQHEQNWTIFEKRWLSDFYFHCHLQNSYLNEFENGDDL